MSKILIRQCNNCTYGLEDPDGDIMCTLQIKCKCKCVNLDKHEYSCRVCKYSEILSNGDLICSLVDEDGSYACFGGDHFEFKDNYQLEN